MRLFVCTVGEEELVDCVTLDKGLADKLLNSRARIYTWRNYWTFYVHLCNIK